MADVWEKDLAQKSSLTTSDFIRVVGSDNVSYKQRVDNVMGAMKVSRTLVENGSDLNACGYDATLGSAFYRGRDISTMTNKPSEEVNAHPWALDAINVNGYIKQILHTYGLSGRIKVYERIQYYASGNVLFGEWQKQPTREEIDALNTHALTTSTLGTLDLNTLPTDKPMRIYLQNVVKNATVERHYPAQVAGFLLHFRASDWILQVYFGFGVSKIYYRQWYDSYGTVPGWSTIS